MGTEERLTELLRRTVEEDGYELVYLELPRAGGRSALRLFIDRIDRPGQVTVEDCQHISERVSVVLDVEDLIPCRYMLEVSSPGLDRPLFKEQDYVRFQGRRARVRTRLAINGQRNFRGVLQQCRDGRVTLLEEDTKTPVEIPLENIKKANLLFEFEN
ncbi:MAG: ribosome maturation factor RimP [Acidobacteria bacterium]|nr:ribosome maturation factor RimP [Acidobacteriota bacterium]